MSSGVNFYEGTVLAEAPRSLNQGAIPVDIMAVSRYTNMAVVQRYSHDNNVSLAEAHVLFEETKKFLAVCASASAEEIIHLSPSEVQDQMWHTFILHTKDYMDFCYDQFGIFLHHVPCTGARENVSPDRARDAAEKMFGRIAPKQWSNRAEMRCCCSSC